ncbi:hypothetical protein DLM75_08785 [Leptospira stimsonii]|uniref:Uncharacterized protein n=1 Tax=Leptospira stimsonii TaxID=2202203 RepID=A0A396Z4V7_9LEPT|nr:hypothetical protein DLM75_08785 [Leptospira stimsonii]
MFGVVSVNCIGDYLFTNNRIGKNFSFDSNSLRLLDKDLKLISSKIGRNVSDNLLRNRSLLGGE